MPKPRAQICLKTLGEDHLFMIKQKTLNNRVRSSSWKPIDARSRSKSKDNHTCNYYKKPGHINAEYCALKVKNDKAQRADRKGDQQEEVNFVGSSIEVLIDDPNILFIEKLVELEILLMIEELKPWLLYSRASYHVTSHRSQFRQYSA